MKNRLLLPILRAAMILPALAAGLAAGAESANPEPEKSSLDRFLERDYLLGDWGGARTWLKDHGINFEFLGAGAVPTTLSGGLKEGSVAQSMFIMMMDVDSQKLAGYEGGQFHVSSAVIQNGRAFSKNFVGDLNQVSLLDFPDGFRLWELWYEQKFLDRKVSLKVGELDIGGDFLVSEYYTTMGMISFLNQTFFFPTMSFNVYDRPAPVFPVENHGLASTPYSAPGVRLRVDPIPQLYLQAGVYGGDPDRSHSGTTFNLSQDEGALAYFEAGYRLNQTPDASGPPGNFKLGGYYHTDDFVDNYDTILAAAGFPGAGTKPPHSGNYGLYAMVDQVLWRERDKDDPARQGLTGFVVAGYAPPDRNLADWGVNGGLMYRGLIPKRDWDSVGLAASYLHMSGDIANAQETINAVVGPQLGRPMFAVADYETVLELNYRAQLTAWWSLQTSVQRVWHPGGHLGPMPNPGDAWVFIVQTAFRF